MTLPDCPDANLPLAGPAWQQWLTQLVAAVRNPTFNNLSVYANDAAAAAGGLVAGQLYRTSTGQVMVVY
jgi:hypothetical protein